MFVTFEDFAVIGAFTLENLCSVVKGVGEEVDLSIAPWEHFAIHPNKAVTIVKRDKCHCFSLPSIHLGVVISMLALKYAATFMSCPDKDMKDYRFLYENIVKRVNTLG